MPKNIFIYDPYAAGHHWGFLHVMLEAFARRPNWRSTLLTSTASKAHPGFRRLAQQFSETLDIVVARDVPQSGLVKRIAGNFYAEQYANSKGLARDFKALNRE